MATLMIGCAMSGNSSVCSCHSEKSPNTTSATIETTVTMGRLMAKSEMNTWGPRLVLRVVGGRAYTERRPLRDAKRRADQQGVAACHAALQFNALRHLVPRAKRDVHALHLASFEPRHDRTDA